MRNTCKSSAASRESTNPPCSRSFRKAVNSVTENLSFMAVSPPTSTTLTVLDSVRLTNVACNLIAGMQGIVDKRWGRRCSYLNPCCDAELRRSNEKWHHFRATLADLPSVSFMTNCVVMGQAERRYRVKLTYSDSVTAWSIRRMGMPSLMGYARRHSAHFRLSGFARNVSGFLHAGQTRISSRS